MANSTFDIDDFQDDKVWDLICDGRTKGVFQLESQLGRSWSKRVKPRNIEELAALISIIRPGCLKAFTEGKSMTQHYVDRKAGIDEAKYLHSSLEPILSETYGVLVYQEQSMKIAQQLAGFDLKEADNLRKAIGKKKAGLMAEVKKSFLSGATDTEGLDKETAEEIFGWIEKSNRYAFNKSHAVSYAVNAYRSAYCKVHRKMRFFESYLNHSERKPDQQVEIKELVSDAKLYDIETLPPRLGHFYPSFTAAGDNIYFGITNIKGVGTAETEKMLDLVPELEKKLGKTFAEFTWLDTLFNLGMKVNKTCIEALITVGAFNGKNNTKHRNSLLYEYKSYRDLSIREREWLSDNYNSKDSIIAAIDNMINNLKINSNRLIKVFDVRNIIESPPFDLTDHPNWIADVENKYMGVALTFSKTDAIQSAAVNCTCREIANGRTGNVNLAIHINSLREYATKNGKNPGQIMAFLSVEDSTATLDCAVIFPETYGKFKEVLYEGNTIVAFCQVSTKKDTSLIINKVSQV
jgi:DNA polymerase III alpha subunit